MDYLGPMCSQAKRELYDHENAIIGAFAGTYLLKRKIKHIPNEVSAI
jgi:hypothetical protein